METQNVYELEPNEKLKILSCLCHQLITQVRFRDLIEDNFQKINNLKAQLRDLQTEENRRIREEASERWRRKMEKIALICIISTGVGFNAENEIAIDWTKLKSIH